MIIRIYEPTAEFGLETTAYYDFQCNVWQIHNGVLHLMRTDATTDLYIPLTSIKLWQQLGPVSVPETLLSNSLMEA